MKVTEDAANRVLRSKVLCVINLVGLFPPDGLHAGDPGYMEDEDDFLTFLSDIRDYQNGVGPAEELVDALILENGIRSQPSDVLSAELEGNQNVLQLIEDSDGEIRNNEMFLRNCFGYAMYQFRNFLKLDSENAALYEFPQEYLTRISGAEGSGRALDRHPLSLTWLHHGAGVRLSAYQLTRLWRSWE